MKKIFVKKGTDSVKRPVEPGADKRFDMLFALTRDFRARLLALESQSSTLRRDVNAVRQKVYRGEDKLVPQDLPVSSPASHIPFWEVGN